MSVDAGLDGGHQSPDFVPLLQAPADLGIYPHESTLHFSVKSSGSLSLYPTSL